MNMNVLQVKPYENSSIERLKSVFQESYFGCKIDFENVTFVSHGGYNSELSKLDVVVSTGESKVKKIVHVVVKDTVITNRIPIFLIFLSHGLISLNED